MQDTPFQQQRDPIAWCALIALGFLAVAWHRLGIPTQIYFDEVHYVPAARKLLELLPANPEHPMLGKEIIAAAIAVLGDKPLYWRVPSALFGAMGLFAFSRLVWFASGRRDAALIATGLLLAVATFWGFLTTFGVAPAVPMWTAVPVWCLGLGLGHVIGKVRGL